MAAADPYRAILYATRAIPNLIAGLRPHTIARVVRYSNNGDPSDEIQEVETPIVEGNGQPPHIRWLKEEEIAVGNLNPGTIEAGPITPTFTGGGTDIAFLRGDDLVPADKLYFRIRGPHHPNGALYRKTKLTDDRALHYTMQLVPVESGDLP